MKASPQLLAPEVLEIGWHTDIPEEIYHSWDLCSNSRLTRMHDSSPAHMRWDVEHPRERADYSKPVDLNDALSIGTAAHFAILQPDLFDTRYFRCPDDLNRSTKEGKAIWADLLAEHVGKIGLKAETWDQCRAMASRVWENLDARVILQSAGQIEVSGIFVPTFEGQMPICKMRIDKLSEQFGFTADIKTCRSANIRKLEREIFERGYHRQGCLYGNGGRALGVEVDRHITIAVEKDAPNAVAVFVMKSDAIALGQQQLIPLLETYRACERANEWPGYPSGLVEIGVPAWAIRELEE